ncbi:DNA polymerase III subunit gamma and tau [Streptomyces sp. PTM05]|uniref:DNA polymerase III subunit gamma/tau n=1 Tax=Streptantibioticus parmotrematis TaxID=2873249 RepID=A0ABS7QYS8_9ACTN|nr:DNA polymerase III subunit gamma and tau [Streptantibioticus parmotrematis]MBY8886937.1 DNA polymerase III subunit gamma and tau [Streptantibioticus parmotrematis]
MSLALYRRYRPESFAEVIGQEHVTDPLSQALRNNRVNHAYLFSGPRGCGKTTSARILARCLNCEQGPTPTPCGECRSCRDLARNGPGSIDVIEIDAASHGGVDDARDLREKAFFGPASSRYKIYIIDEAHMVTSAGFNALLKVVEEPPEHLKFIFATTEPEKVIGTIRSRTHHYPFRLVPPGTLRDYLAEVCGREDIAVENGVYPLVVRAGAGSVRDSMSVMDQLLAGAGESGVTYAMATALLGYTDAALLDDVVDAFAAGDGAAAFEIVDRVIEGGHDPRRFVADLLERLRDLVILAAVPDAGEKGLIDAPADVVERMAAQASVFGAAELSRAADLVNTGLTEMRGATSPRLQLELICARVLLPAAYDDERAVAARLDRLERQALAGGLAAPAGYAPQPDGGVQVTGAVDGSAVARAAVRPGQGGPGQAPAPTTPLAPAPAPAPAAPAAPAPVPDPPAAPSAPAPASPAQAAPATGDAPAAPAARVPGAWPTAARPGSGGAPPAPGAWPTAAPPQSSPAAPAPAAPAQAPAPAPAAPSQAPAPSGSGSGSGSKAVAGDPSRVRQMWPDILEAVKNRRRFTWILLSQNAQVVGFDGTTLQLGFANPGARDSFVSGGSEDVLRQAVNDLLHVEWKIEALVDPSGGGGGGAQGGFGPPGSSGPQGGGFPGPSRPSAGAPSGAAPSAPFAPPAHSGQGGPGGQARGPQQPQQPSSGPEPSRGAAPSAPEPPPVVSVEDDIPEDDDPDLDDTALTGHDLIVRELGATVIEEIVNE